MRLKFRYFFLALLGVFILNTAHSQKVSQYKYKNEIYNVYPYRVSDEDIPVVGLNIPDGKYIVFDNYSFKRKFSFQRRKKKYVLHDTAKVKAIVGIKNNLPEGPAVFYYYDMKRNRTYHKKAYSITSGSFVNGLKEGPWERKNTDNSFHQVCYFKAGQEHGYCLTYNSDGKLSKKIKYCNGIQCDTVFYYYNGKLYEEYDVCPPHLLDKRSNIYSEALHLSGNYTGKEAKTYFKRYNLSDGKVEVDLKYKNGRLLHFDSMGSKQYTLRYKKFYERYAAIRSLGDKHQVLVSVNKSHNRDTYRKAYYYDGFRYMYKEEDVVYRYKRRLFRKEKLVNTYNDIKEEYTLNPDSINGQSTDPVLISRSLRYGVTTTTYAIPKYNFVFNSDKGRKFLSLDTANKILYLNQQESGWNNLSKKYVGRYIAEKERKLNEAKIYPFLLKEFILTTSINLHNSYDIAYDMTHPSLHNERTYFTELYRTYLKKDTLMNGKWCFHHSEKPIAGETNIKYISFSRFERDIALGDLKDGKKTGEWKELEHSRSPKTVPSNFKDWFFTHPKTASEYVEKNYVNGLLDGPYVKYVKESVYKERRNGKTGKEIRTLYKKYEMAYKRDSLDGKYYEYYDNGKIRVEGNFVVGRPDGDYKTFFFDGTPASFIQFKMGKLHGKYLKYDAEGIKCYANFKDNVLSDSLIYYQPGGRMTCIYTNMEKVKKKRMYFADGKLKEEVVFDDASEYMFGKETISPETFINTLRTRENKSISTIHASYKNYYDNGQLLSEGHIHNGELSGKWKFYSLNGTLLHEVDFRNDIVYLPNHVNETNIDGSYTGYYSNGKLRAKGYLKDMDISYDCFTKQDKADFEFYVLEFYNNDGLQTVKQGNGFFVKYDPNGLRMAMGKLVNCMPDSLWKFYTPEQKLTEVGHYVNELKEGIWYSGDLEGVNFEDGACFDLSNPAELKAYEKKRRVLDISRHIYSKGVKMSSKSFHSNLNKTYQPRGRHHANF